MYKSYCRNLSFRLPVCRKFANLINTSTLESTTNTRIKINKLLSSGDAIVGQSVLVQGWVRTVRDQSKFVFVELNDGSCINSIQTIVDCESPSFEIAKVLTTGCAAEITGTVVVSPGKGQKYELQANNITLVGACCGETYPLQKKRHTLEHLRSVAHIRGRTNTLSAVARVRSALALSTHQFFQSEGFTYIQTPLITASDCEGAGEMFRVTTLPLNKLSTIKRTDEDSADFSTDFFARPAFLTVSGQLSGEAYASALGDIYTFGPTFRAEKSLSSRHLAEFHMIEPEMAFADLHSAMNNAEMFVKHVVRHARDNCKSDLEFLEKFGDKTISQRLNKLVDRDFTRIAYTDAVVMLQKEINKNKSKWQFPDVKFGTDLQTEHERWLAERKFEGCVFVHNYPREIKSFYMRDNGDGRTVDSFDLLVPNIGELIGGSSREERLEVLQHKMSECGLRREDYSWYLDLRRFGSVPHAGYGLGFERLVCMVTGIENIRDAIAFPRYFGHAEF